MINLSVRKSVGLLLALLLFLLVSGFFVLPVAAAPSLEVIKRENALNYPLSIEFGITLRPSVTAGPKTKADLEYQLLNSRSSHTARTTLTRQPANLLELAFKLEARDFVFTGEKVRYRWVITFDDGSKATTDSQDLLYFDNRFEWNDATRGLQAIHWYNGGPEFVDDIGKLAENQREKLRQRFGLISIDLYSIWLYDRQDPMSQVFKDPEIRNFLGVASPLQRVTVLLFPPTTPGTNRYSSYVNTLEHELTHLVLNSYIGRPIPNWFDEGFATFATEPHPEIRKAIVNKAAGTDTFIPLQKLVTASDFYSLNLNLAYSEAATLLGYLSAAYNEKILVDTIQQYRRTGGTGISRVITNLTNTTLDELEKNWLVWLKDGTLPTTASAAASPSPALVPTETPVPAALPLTPPAFPTLISETLPTATPSSTAPVSAATATPPASTTGMTPGPTQTSGLKIGVSPKNNLAVNSLLPLVAIGGTLLLMLALGLTLALFRRHN